MARTAKSAPVATIHGNAEGQGTTAGHNAQARTEAIRDALEEMYQTDKKIADLIERHVQPLRDQKRDIKKKMRETYEVSTRQFNARYGLYQMERAAQENQDDTVLGLIQELFDVAPVGRQMDWLDAADAADGRAAS